MSYFQHLGTFLRHVLLRGGWLSQVMRLVIAAGGLTLIGLLFFIAHLDFASLLFALVAFLVIAIILGDGAFVLYRDERRKREGLEDQAYLALAPSLSFQQRLLQIDGLSIAGSIQPGVSFSNRSDIPIRYLVQAFSLISDQAQVNAAHYANNGNVVLRDASTTFWGPEMTVIQGAQLPMTVQVEIEMLYWNARSEQPASGFRMIRVIKTSLSLSQVMPVEGIQPFNPSWLFTREVDERVADLQAAIGEKTLVGLSSPQLDSDMAATQPE